MEPTSFLFYTFSLILLAAAVAVVTVKNPVYAALFLVLSFFSASAIWILLGAEFLALTLVLVYVGAVMVLFLFEMFAIISYGFSNYSNSEENISSSSNTYQIGM